MKKMCKKVVSLLLAAVMVLTMTAFASVVYAADEDSVEADPNFKMGVILVGDETEGYSAAHIAGVKQLKSWALTTARLSGNTKFRKTPAATMQQSTLLDRDAPW